MVAAGSTAADELAETIDALPLKAEQSAVMGLSAMSTVHGLARAFDEMVDGRTPRVEDDLPTIV